MCFPSIHGADALKGADERSHSAVLSLGSSVPPVCRAAPHGMWVFYSHGQGFLYSVAFAQFSPLGSQVKKQRPVPRMEGSQLCHTHQGVTTVGVSVREGGPELGLPDKIQDTQSHLNCRLTKKSFFRIPYFTVCNADVLPKLLREK